MFTCPRILQWALVDIRLGLDHNGGTPSNRRFGYSVRRYQSISVMRKHLKLLILSHACLCGLSVQALVAASATETDLLNGIDSHDSLIASGWEHVSGSLGDGGALTFGAATGKSDQRPVLRMAPGLDADGAPDHNVYHSRRFGPYSGRVRLSVELKPESHGAMVVLSGSSPFGDRAVVYFRNGEQIRLYDGGVNPDDFVDLPAYDRDRRYRVLLEATTDLTGEIPAHYSVRVYDLDSGKLHGEARDLRFIGNPRALERVTIGVMNSSRARCEWYDMVVEAMNGELPEPLRMRSMPGEYLPRILGGNALPGGDFADGPTGWHTAAKDGTSLDVVDRRDGDGRYLTLIKDGGWETAWLVSDSFPVEGGREWILTGLYRTEDASFGNFGEWVIQSGPDPDFENPPRSSTWPSKSAHTGNMNLFNSPGEWRRKTRSIHIPANHAYARAVFIMDGPPMTLDIADIVLYKPEPDTRVPKALEPEAELPHDEVLQRLANRPDSTARVCMRADEPVLLVDEMPKVPYMHMADVVYPMRGYISDFADHGIDIHFITLFNKTQRHWTGPGQYDFEKLDKIIWNSVRRNPEGYFIFYLNLLPYEDWHLDFPEGAAVNRAGEPMMSRHGFFAPASYWAQSYRQQVLDLTRAYIQHINQQPYARSIIGYFIGGGEDGQFYFQGVRGQQTIQDGQAPDDLPTLRAWLRDHYGDDVDALRRAWNDDTLEFETVAAPVENHKYDGVFIDPASQRPQYDFFRFLNESLAMLLVEIAEVIKEEAEKPVIVGAYYGRGAGQMVYPLFAQTSVMFPQGMIDFMGAQGGYFGWREVGSPGIMNWVYDSLRRNRILPMMELDFRTWFGGFQSLLHDFRVARYWNIDDFVNAVARDAGKTFSVGGGVWWMEMVGGWYHDEAIMDFLGRITSISQELYEEPVEYVRSPVVLIVDEDTFFRTTEQINIWNGPHYHSVNLQQRAFHLSGVPLDFHYLSEIMGDDPESYDVYYFLNPFYLSEPLKQWVREIEAAGKTIIWQYAPGWLSANGFSTDGMRELSGFEFRHRAASDRGLLAYFVREPDHAAGPHADTLLRNLGGDTLGIGVDIPADRFAVSGGYDGVLARFADDDSIAAAYRVEPDSGSVTLVLGHPSAITPDLLANIARMAGVHCYTRPGDLFFHQRSDLVVMHGVSGGTQVLNLPAPMNVKELIHGEIEARNSRELQFEIKPGQTFWFYLSPAAD